MDEWIDRLMNEMNEGDEEEEEEEEEDDNVDYDDVDDVDDTEKEIRKREEGNKKKSKNKMVIQVNSNGQVFESSSQK
ncbi:hypothetical protein Glove_120g220 [Diversispora epigaea]|uniref:Uncharacterized protein n=1 Tax=Diversispora epigaea TaxID=1348612 RepID=A0A397IZB5_9GLOM|nr:hypothetical protein Glove_120g220 [Diversispora epigaea]